MTDDLSFCDNEIYTFINKEKKHNDKLLFIAGILETQRKRSGPSRSNGKISISWITQLVSKILIRWIVIYAVGSTI